MDTQAFWRMVTRRPLNKLSDDTTLEAHDDVAHHTHA
jgi:hypothetical protein